MMVYADDIEFLNKSPKAAQKCIIALERGLDWSQTLRAKPSKCRTLAFKVFKDSESKYQQIQSTCYSCFDPKLTISGEYIRFIGNDNPPCFKYLGRWFQHDLKDTWVRESITSKLISWIQTIDNTCLSGPMKAWILNHHVCAKLAWSLMIYDFPDSLAIEWQRELQKSFRKWIGLNATVEASILYRHTEHFGLNFKYLPFSLHPFKFLNGTF